MPVVNIFLTPDVHERYMKVKEADALYTHERIYKLGLAMGEARTNLLTKSEEATDDGGAEGESQS